VFGNLASHQIARVVISDSNQHIGSGGTNTFKCGCLATITADNYTTQLFAESIASSGILLQDQHLMAIVE
jgi:hypothetical protein